MIYYNKLYQICQYINATFQPTHQVRASCNPVNVSKKTSANEVFKHNVFGTPGRNRTYNLILRTDLLFHLSYRGVNTILTDEGWFR